MKNMTKILFLCATAALLGACDGDDEGDDTGGTIDAAPTPDSAPTVDAGPPAKPTPGAQIERMGRPAVNTALMGTYGKTDLERGTLRDAYNSDGNKAGWPAAHTTEIARNLAILDALDGTCGNQLLAGAMPVAGRYNGLAAVLADDQLYVNSAPTTCGSIGYLAVEANATMLVPNTDCGGRKLDYQVIDRTYGVVAAGNIGGIADGAPLDIGFTSTALATFPYLGLPTTPP